MILHAVIDTNILVSALLSSNPVSPTKGVIDHVRDGNIAPILLKNMGKFFHDVNSISPKPISRTL